MEQNEYILSKLKLSVLEIFPNCKLILFGSRAKMNYTKDSDFDILIILPYEMDVKKKMNYKAILRRDLVNNNIIADILIESENEVKEKKILLGHIVREAIKEGVEL